MGRIHVVRSSLVEELVMWVVFTWSGVAWLKSWSCARNVIRAPRRVPSLATWRAKVNCVRPPLDVMWTHRKVGPNGFDHILSSGWAPPPLCHSCDTQVKQALLYLPIFCACFWMLLSTQNRVSYRILSWGGEQGGSRMIVACESTLMHMSVYMPTRGVWGHAPAGRFWI